MGTSNVMTCVCRRDVGVSCLEFVRVVPWSLVLLEWLRPVYWSFLGLVVSGCVVYVGLILLL
jgi:hypothetical protein